MSKSIEHINTILIRKSPAIFTDKPQTLAEQRVEATATHPMNTLSNERLDTLIAKQEKRYQASIHLYHTVYEEQERQAKRKTNTLALTLANNIRDHCTEQRKFILQLRSLRQKKQNTRNTCNFGTLLTQAYELTSKQKQLTQQFNTIQQPGFFSKMAR